MMWLAVGLLLGGISVLSFAATTQAGTSSGGATWFGGLGQFFFDSAGNAKSANLNLPPTSSSNGTSLSIPEEGRWELIDRDGSKISTPGKITLNVPAAKLAGAAAGIAFRSPAAGIIAGYLAQEGINLLNGKWSKKEDQPNIKYNCVNSPCQLVSSVSEACDLEFQRASAIILQAYPNHRLEKRPAIPVGKDYTCRMLHIYPSYAQEESSGGAMAIDLGTIQVDKEASQSDLDQALNNRTKMINESLKDYYQSLDDAAKQSVATDPANGVSIQGNSVQGKPQTTETTNPDGSKTTQTTTVTYNINQQGDTYNQSSVNVTQTTNTTTTNTSSSGQTTTTTTSSTSPPTGQPQPDYAFSDTAFPAIPKLYEPKYPDGIKGVWDTKIATLKGTPIFTFLHSLGEGAPSGGTCPSWSYNLNFGSAGNFGSWQMQPPCVIWPFIRWTLIIFSLFAARRIVFGG